MTSTLVVVADAMPIFRSAAQSVLRRDGGFRVMDATTLEELLAAVRAESPDVALIDLDLPPHGGVAAVAALPEAATVRTILWSYSPSREAVYAAIKAGADGYLEKRISAAGLVAAIRGIERGEAPLSRDLAHHLVGAVHAREKRGAARERTQPLSPREREVLELISRGHRNRDIAAALFISEFTVKRHVQNILEKLELPSRAAAAQIYRSAFASGSIHNPASQEGR